MVFETQPKTLSDQPFAEMDGSLACYVANIFFLPPREGVLGGLQVVLFSLSFLWW